MVLGDSHHFDFGLETGAFPLVDHVDFHRIWFRDDGTARDPTAKIVHCFVGNNHLQVEHLY